MHKQKMHVSTLNKRSMPGLKFGSNLGKSRMSWCLDTNHFVVIPLPLESYYGFSLWEGVICSRQPP